MPHAGVLGGSRHREHLGNARLGIRGRGRHEQQPVDARERGRQGVEVVVVGLADLDAALGQIDGRARVTDADSQRRVGRATQDLFDDEAAELAVGSGDQRHSAVLLVGET
jgi:hypothetical protein